MAAYFSNVGKRWPRKAEVHLQTDGEIQGITNPKRINGYHAAAIVYNISCISIFSDHISGSDIHERHLVGDIIGYFNITNTAETLINYRNGISHCIARINDRGLAGG